MELIGVTTPEYFNGEAELINQLFAEGLHLLHIRKPMDNVLQFRELMKGIKPEYYPLISIHQHHELAQDFAIQRLHFKEHQRKDLPCGMLKKLVSDGFLLSSSVHDLSEIDELQDFSYVFFGPVFNSISKTGYNTVLGDDFILPAHTTKVFALGGVQADKMKQIQQMNFDGAAVLGSLWHQEVTPLAALKNLLTAGAELKHNSIDDITDAPFTILNTNTSRQ